MALLLCAALLAPAAARAGIPGDKIKVVIIDRTGPTLQQDSRNMLVAAEMAAEDFEARNNDEPDVEIKELNDNEPAFDADVVRGWLDHDHIDVVIDIAGTSAAPAIARLMQAHDRLFVLADFGGPTLRAAARAPTTIDWGIDPAALSASLVDALKRRGDGSWTFLASREALPQALTSDAARLVAAGGGQVVATIDHPLGLRDIQHDMLRANASAAQVIGLSEMGPEFAEAMETAAFLGMPLRHRMAALMAPIAMIDQTGLQTAQGLYVAAPFYWNRNKASRNFTERFVRMSLGRMPSEADAITYSSMIAVLHAVKATDSVVAGRLIAQLRRAPIPDHMLGTITLRADNTAAHDMYVFRVKRPGESRQAWDYYDLVATIPAAQAFRPIPAAQAGAATAAPGPDAAGRSPAVLTQGGPGTSATRTQDEK